MSFYASIIKKYKNDPKLLAIILAGLSVVLREHPELQKSKTTKKDWSNLLQTISQDFLKDSLDKCIQDEKDRCAKIVAKFKQQTKI